MFDAWLKLSTAQVEALRIAVEDDLIQCHRKSHPEVRFAPRKTVGRLAALGLVVSFQYQGWLWCNPTTLGETALKSIDDRLAEDVALHRARSSQIKPSSEAAGQAVPA